MKYFKNTELAKLYNVSEKSVRNWIDAAEQGKLDLHLHQENGKMYIANISSNNLLVEQLVQKGKKYKNTRGYKVISPTDKFYDLYSRKQIVDIISSLEIHKEIPRQYNYFDGGAEYWDRFAWHMWEEDAPNLLKGSIELLNTNMNALDLLIGTSKRVNIVDLGVGNALPVKKLLAKLSERGQLHRYIAVDISSEMLAIAEENINKWFKGAVPFEGHVRDITYERFDDLLVEDMLQQDNEETVNLVLFLGATLMNFRSPYDVLKVIYGSMGQHDLLFYTDKPDTEAERRYFDVNAEAEVAALSPKYRFILDLLNIDPSLYDVEMGFNARTLERYIRIKLKVAITLKFSFENAERRVELNKGDSILMWRAWHQTTLGLITEFDKVGLTLLLSSTTKDRQYLLTVSGVNIAPNS
ncbi:MAG TPA: L-histidine N(alpha)-methyltransferase [Patescibacteria group bacterium]|nr:L-histidine N(alpha)-methyltransferase [Patescibacteria group bacterium]